MLSGGCGAQQAPFKFHDVDDLAHYNKIATDIEYPNVAECPSDNSTNCPSPALIGPDSQPPYWDLKLEGAMQMGLAKSKVLHDLGGTVLRSPPNIRTIADPAIVETDPRFGVEAALSEFDAVFNSKFDYQRNNRFVNNVFFGGGTRELRQDTDIWRSELTKTAATGSTFTFAHNTVYDHNNSPGNLFKSSWDTNIEASWRQPLLQGAGVEYNRIVGPKGSPGNLDGVLIARVNTDISLADFEMGLRDLVSNIENSYWDLYFAYRDLDAKIVARDNALDSWRKTHALFLTGKRGGEAEKEAEAREQYFSFQEEVQNAWSGRLYEPTQTNNGSGGGTFRATGGVRVCERRLRYLLGLPTSDGRLIRPADEPSLAKVVFNWEDVLPESINRRPELRRQRWAIKRDELALIGSRNFLLPKLDSFALYRVRGFGHELKDGPDGIDENSAFQDLLHGDHLEYEAGLQLSVPLGERQGHAAVRNAQLLLSRDRALLDDQERNVVLDVSNAMAEVDRAYQVAQTAFNRRMAAKADLSSTKAAYESDKAPLDLYLDAQRRSAVAESQFFATLVEYTLAIKNLHYSKGSLLDYNEIYLSEGPWPGKAYCDAADRRPSRWQPKALNYIFHQPPPVSIGTEPNYPLPPPISPVGTPPAPGQTPGPQPEELPKTNPQLLPQTSHRPQSPLMSPTFAHTPAAERSAPPTPTFAQAPTPAPQASAPSPPTQSLAMRSTPALPQVAAAPATPSPTTPSPSTWQRDASKAAPQWRSESGARTQPQPDASLRPTVASSPAPNASGAPWSNKPAQDFVAKTAPAAALPPALQAAVQPPLPPAKSALSWTNPSVAAPTPPPESRPASSAEDRTAVQVKPAAQPVVQPAKAPPTTGALNWGAPQQKTLTPQPVERWPVSADATPGATTNNRSSMLRPEEVEVPHESIYTASARQRESRAPAETKSELLIRSEPSPRPRPSVSDTRPGLPAPAINNDLRPHYYPVEARPATQPWPTGPEPSGKGVQPTTYNGQSTEPGHDNAPSSQGLRSLPPVSDLQTLPPVSSTPRLPPIAAPSSALPPIRE